MINQQKRFRQKGWYSDSRRFYNREEVPQDQLQRQSETVSGILSFENCFQPNLLTLISEVKFPNLIDLQLGHNNITSIEPISRVFMPSLKSIKLSYNRITFIKSLRKGYWPQLQFLNLRQNKIKDWQFLTELRMVNDFYFLTIAGRYEKNKTIQQDIAWLAKIQPNLINNINYLVQVDRYYRPNQMVRDNQDNQYQYQNRDMGTTNFSELFKKRLWHVNQKFVTNPQKSVFTNVNSFVTSRD